MCTSIAFRTNKLYFGRNMDLEYDFGQRVVITPRSYEMPLKCSQSFTCQHAIIGTATVIDNYPLYADAANEYGLCMAGLNFPYNAEYSKEPDLQKRNITPFELIPYILGSCQNLAKAKEMIKNICLVDIPFSPNVQLTPLHWHIADNSSCAVIEYTQSGMHVYENYADTLTNNPAFECQLAHLANFTHLTSKSAEDTATEYDMRRFFSKGMGAHGLPGDFSSSSRFVKSAFVLKNAKKYNDTNADIAQFFHILDTTAVVSGCIDLQNGKDYFTRYSCCIDCANGVYYCKTYKSAKICAVKLNDDNKNTDNLTQFNLEDTFEVSYLN